MSATRRCRAGVERMGSTVVLTVPFPTDYAAIEFYDHCTAETIAAALSAIGTAEVYFAPGDSLDA